MKIYLKNFSFVLLLVSLHSTPMHATGWWERLFGPKEEAPGAQPTHIPTTTQPEPRIRQTPQEEQFVAQENRNSGLRCLFRYFIAMNKNANPTEANFDVFKKWLLESTDSQPAQTRMELMQDGALVQIQLEELSAKITANQDLSFENMTFILGFTGWHKTAVIIAPQNFKGNPPRANDRLTETIEKLKSSPDGFFVCIQGKDRTWSSKFIPALGQSNFNGAAQNYESSDPYVQAALDLCTGSVGFQTPEPLTSSTTTQMSSTTTTVPQTHTKPQEKIDVLEQQKEQHLLAQKGQKRKANEAYDSAEESSYEDDVEEEDSDSSTFSTNPVVAKMQRIAASNNEELSPKAYLQTILDSNNHCSLGLINLDDNIEMIRAIFKSKFTLVNWYHTKGAFDQDLANVKAVCNASNNSLLIKRAFEFVRSQRVHLAFDYRKNEMNLEGFAFKKFLRNFIKEQDSFSPELMKLLTTWIIVIDANNADLRERSQIQFYYLEGELALMLAEWLFGLKNEESVKNFYGSFEDRLDNGLIRLIHN